MFKTQATAYGCEHEKAARESYAILAQEKHTNFHIRSSGLIVDTACPHLGATPDGWVECDCCGSGVLEIKCPYSCRESAISERASEKRFCLEKDERGKMTLKTAHEYYYQVQAQLYLSHVNFADFVVWNKEEIFLQRILPNAPFIVNVVDKVTTFFKIGLLPEILGKYFTRERVPQMPASESTSSPPLWCYCKKEESGKIICCDNDNYLIQWFHISCLKISRVNDGKWYCPTVAVNEMSRKSRRLKVRKSANRVSNKCR